MSYIIQKKIKTVKDLLDKWSRWSKKDLRKDHKREQISNNKWTKKLVRRYQSENEGKNPLPYIPNNTFYCYTAYVRPNADKKDFLNYETVPCHFWYSIKIPSKEINDHPRIVAVGQTHIGGCRLLKKTDDDMGGWGLLWDMVKECHLCGEK